MQPPCTFQSNSGPCKSANMPSVWYFWDSISKRCPCIAQCVKFSHNTFTTRLESTVNDPTSTIIVHIESKPEVSTHWGTSISSNNVADLEPILSTPVEDKGSSTSFARGADCNAEPIFGQYNSVSCLILISSRTADRVSHYSELSSRKIPLQNQQGLSSDYGLTLSHHYCPHHKHCKVWGMHAWHWLGRTIIHSSFQNIGTRCNVCVCSGILVVELELLSLQNLRKVPWRIGGHAIQTGQGALMIYKHFSN